ncbi:MAG: hypothetical protein ACYSR9_13090 [Planctomycetota bacterium]
MEQMLKSGLTIYQVSKMVKGKVPQRTVYAFLTGEKDAGTETASIIMNALGLTIKTKTKKITIMKGIKVKEKKASSFRGRVIADWEKAGKPSWNQRELLGICLLIDLEFRREGKNPAPKFRSAVGTNDYSYLIQWSQGLHIPWGE